MKSELSSDTIACDLRAIPPERRTAHKELVRSLLQTTTVTELDQEIQFDIPADQLNQVALFIDNERRCCPHLAFSLEVPARHANLVLRVKGRAVVDELRALAS